jgi:hypothetical protein
VFVVRNFFLAVFEVAKYFFVRSNMGATLSIETKVQNFLTLRDCSADFISSLAQLHGIPGASSSRLSQAFRGRDLPEETAKPLGQMIDDLESYCRSVSPVPVALRNAVTIKSLLDDFRRDAQVRPIPFTVIVIGSQLFKSISSGQVETTTDYQDCAAFENFLVARAAAQLLNSRTNEHLRVTTITNEPRSADEFVTKLADVGFES